ncbi:MAG: class I SAM-dependent methyltransferase [Candidatus Portnoybacteria bacterium]|nr:class I SAM-dependent methyltransferase [Candidatus Portnoybacteria bacterium]
MKKSEILPEAATYEKELFYMPYRESLAKVIEIICSEIPKGGSLMDLMCGPGYLLAQISKRRKDLILKGVDLDQGYIKFSKEKYPKLDFEVGDIMSWESNEKFDFVVCTGSVHHIPYEKQSKAIEKIASFINPKGTAIISDCYIDNYLSEKQRKIAAAKLGYEYLIETIKNGAPKEVVEATGNILVNDVLMNEFKTSLKKRISVFERFFSKIKTIKTWPKFDSQYGDYISICRK